MLSPEALDYQDFINPYLKLATWGLHFCIIPRKCILTNKIIWLKDCYRGVRSVPGPRQTTQDIFYMSTEEFLMWSIKNYE
jgi:hypothetical protein